MHVVFTESWNNFFQIFHIFNLDFFFMLQYYESVYVVGTLWVQPPTVLYHSHWN